jgi:hypothetical protein
MKTFKIKNKEISVDESKLHLDFYTQDGTGNLVKYDMVKVLDKLQNKEIDKDDIEFFVYLERWNVDAPRKRFYRDMRRSGIGVLSGEYFFDKEENSDEILDGLQNTGTIAKEVLEVIAPEKVGAFWKGKNES